MQARVPRAAPRLRRVRGHRRGQALVEFALVLPVLLVMLLLAIDAGRLFFGWENLQNASRIAANYAADFPLAWGTSPNLQEQSQYDAQIQADATTINCVLPSPLPTPSFPDGYLNADGTANLGGRAQVTLTCGFTLLTPLLGNILGNPVELGATSVFPIKGGIISTVVPTATPSPAPTATPAPSGTPSPCTVPVFTGTRVFDAAKAWASAGFVPSNLTEALGNGNYYIETETPPGSDGTSQSCSTFVLTVGP